MADEQLECPADDLLMRFAAGELEAVLQDRVRAHLTGCATCLQRVRCWRTSEPEWECSGTRSIGTGDSIPYRPNPDDESEYEEAFDFASLQPSKHPGALGRMGDLHILGVIGDGAMGIVLRAVEEPLQRMVAVKVLKRQLCTSEKARRRFIREARAAAGINHHNVVTIYSVQAKGPFPYLIMEHVGGGTLRDLIRSQRRLSVVEVVQLARDIAEGLAAAHRQGVIHRDIKPGNILLQPGSVRVKISDFGLARVLLDNSDLTSQGSTVGTPAYMSPEQVAGKPIDHRTDLFSLGCVIYTMVAGDSPFRGGSQLETARRITSWDPPPLDQVVEGTPRFLADVTAKLLAKNPESRFGSAEEVATALDGYLGVLNQTATDEWSAVLRTATPTLPRRRRRRWQLLAASLMMLVVAAASWKFWPPGDPPNPPPGGVPTVLIVGGPPESPDAVSTLAEALRRAGPGAHIRLLPSSEYTESIVIDDPRRLRGIVVEGEPGNPVLPVLRGNPDRTPIITVRGVCGVQIRGLELRPEGGRGILVEGEVNDIVIERIRCLEPVSGGDPGVYLSTVAGSPDGPPVTVRDSHFESPGYGQCITIIGDHGEQPILIENNEFVGRGVLVLAGHVLKDVTIRGNIFRLTNEPPPAGQDVPQSTVGLNLNLTEVAGVRRFHVYNNTFVTTQEWLGTVYTDTEVKANIAVCNNLILGATGIQASSQALEAAARNWDFRANWWEITPRDEDQRRLWRRVAELHSRIAVTQRVNPTAADYLQPPPDSSLLTAGVGGGGFPAYVGARRPGTIIAVRRTDKP